MINADNLAVVRSFYDLTQNQLAVLVGVSQPYIAQVEGGARPMTDSLRSKLTAALELTPAKMARIFAIQEQMNEFRK